MSRIGKLPILIPDGVEVKITENVLTAKGPKGEESVTLPEEIEVKIEQKNLFDLPDLSEDEKIIYEALEIEDKCVDELQAQTKFSIDSLLTLLTTMELKGIIKQVDGDRYKRVNPVKCS